MGKVDGQWFLAFFWRWYELKIPSKIKPLLALTYTYLFCKVPSLKKTEEDNGEGLLNCNWYCTAQFGTTIFEDEFEFLVNFNILTVNTILPGSLKWRKN